MMTPNDRDDVELLCFVVGSNETHIHKYTFNTGILQEGADMAW